MTCQNPEQVFKQKYTSMPYILDLVTRKNKHSLNIFIPFLNMRNMESNSQIAFLRGRA